MQNVYFYYQDRRIPAGSFVLRCNGSVKTNERTFSEHNNYVSLTKTFQQTLRQVKPIFVAVAY